MSAYSEIYVALVSGSKVTADDAARLLAQLRVETAHELAQQQRAHADAEYRPTPADPYAQQRIKRRKRGAVYTAAALIDPHQPGRRTNHHRSTR